eukprot:TRINITY_DN67673_c6_g1_i1.p1 TRINITY_DN67673_c6_g1~~TRINITY_DN67673_c6_g1_i1.p1  ORF type:complete len:308 (-),score=43.32 TRINITY_DN67673_c6_g1_i1:646-1530(-)
MQEHTDMIHDSQFDYYGTRVASCSSDRTINIYTVKDNTTTLASTIRGHNGPVWQVAWAHPKFGSLLASCSYDHKVIIWKEEPENTWIPIFQYQEQTSSVNSIAWGPAEYGLMLASGSSDGTVAVLEFNQQTKQWNATKFEAHQIGCNSVAWAPNGCKFAGDEGESRVLASAGCDNLICLWRFDAGSSQWQKQTELRGHNDWVRDVSFSPATSLPSPVLASAAQDNSVIIWKQDSTLGTWEPSHTQKFESAAWRVSWNVTGNILAITTGDNAVTLLKEVGEGEGKDAEWKIINTL